MSGRSTIFSIITVSYNAVGDIERTVRSVMEQDFRDFEYLIIDGASKDGTPKKAAEITGRYDDINVTIISEPDSGIYDAMNKGLDLAAGEYLIFSMPATPFMTPTHSQCSAEPSRATTYPVSSTDRPTSSTKTATGLPDDISPPHLN